MRVLLQKSVCQCFFEKKLQKLQKQNQVFIFLESKTRDGVCPGERRRNDFRND